MIDVKARPPSTMRLLPSPPVASASLRCSGRCLVCQLRLWQGPCPFNDYTLSQIGQISWQSETFLELFLEAMGRA